VDGGEERREGVGNKKNPIRLFKKGLVDWYIFVVFLFPLRLG
jgi:hypothetical protein